MSFYQMYITHKIQEYITYKQEDFQTTHKYLPKYLKKKKNHIHMARKSMIRLGRA